ncbi:uncharacterized protein LOC127873782 isoform X2 [Dreissena polymorpha]|uniref:uncharacterized protein LOC127873782 isoform X2 n=1 Tax=Dreissena polymorpha TaxID=45954 RepID=UPI0022653779|nr:uncharacterized protein LOC127873782 isoform X2 [Dreissena polymorpha]
MWNFWVLICLTSVARMTPLPHIAINVLTGSILNITCTFHETSTGNILFYKLNGNTTEARLKIENDVGQCSLTSGLSPKEVNCSCLDTNSVVCNISGDKNVQDNYTWKCATFTKNHNHPFYSNVAVVQKDGQISRSSTYATLKDTMSTWRTYEVTEILDDKQDQNIPSTVLASTSSVSYSISETEGETTWMFDSNTGVASHTTGFRFDITQNKPNDTLEALENRSVTTASKKFFHDSFYPNVIISSASVVLIILTATLFTCVYRKYRTHSDDHDVSYLTSPEDANVLTRQRLSSDHYDRIPSIAMSSIVECNLPNESECEQTSVKYFEVISDTSVSDVLSDKTDGSKAQTTERGCYEDLLQGRTDEKYGKRESKSNTI